MIENDINDARSLVAITSVDLKNMVFEGKAMIDRPKQLTMTILPGSTWVIPSVGEQWLIQRNGKTWHLLSKINFQDPRALLPQSEGMYAYGGLGKTHIVGESVSIHAPLFVEDEPVRPATQKPVEIATPSFQVDTGSPVIVPLSSTEAGSGMVAVTVGGALNDIASSMALDISLAGQSKTVVGLNQLGSVLFSETFFVMADEISGVAFNLRSAPSCQVGNLAIRITSL